VVPHFASITLTDSVQVNTNANIPFNTATNSVFLSPDSHIHKSTTTGVFNVASSGYYEFAFGFLTYGMNQNSRCEIALMLNDVATADRTAVGGGRAFTSLQTIQRLTANSTTVSLKNTGSQTCQLRNAANDNNMCAYMTIKKLSD
jgi:hypothetical protein